jgi:hypothetical protein
MLAKPIAAYSVAVIAPLELKANPKSAPKPR